MGAASSSHTHTDTALIVACDDDDDATPTPTSTPTPTAAAAAALECMRSLCGLSIDKSHRQRAVNVAVVVVAAAVAVDVVAVVAASAADSCIYCFARPLALHGVKRAQSRERNNKTKNPIEKPQVELKCFFLLIRIYSKQFSGLHDTN